MRFFQEEDITGFHQMQFVFIKTELIGYVLRITLNRPEKRNAFTPTMVNEIIFALAYAHYSPQVRCVLIEAEGTVFCAGADLNAFHNPDMDFVNSQLPNIREEARLGDAFSQLLKPSIAVVKGAVLAGGYLLICGCTIVLASPQATFGLPEVKRGIWPMQVMESLRGIVPDRKILEMAISGKNYSAGDALAMGLLTQICELDRIQTEADRLAELICENAPYAIQTGLRAWYALPTIPINERHLFLKQQLELLLLSEDAREGTSAFREKRSPKWVGK